jgi:cell wall-associated NlpC family hydrolase
MKILKICLVLVCLLVSGYVKADVVYEVKKGDSLARIACLYDVSLQKIKQANNVNKYIYPGEEIVIPLKEVYAPKSDYIYTVKKGDSLISIAKHFNLSVETLKKNNRLETNRIIPGDELYTKKKLPPKNLYLTEKRKDYSILSFNKIHVVKQRESLYSLSQQYDVPINLIKLMNEIRGNIIRKGDMLLVPGEVEYVTIKERASNILYEIRRNAAERNFQANAKGRKAARIAKQYLGIPYKYGGTGKNGIDCSAFVQSVYRKLRIHLPRTTKGQINIGKPVRLSKLKVGDLVFFKAHGKRPSHVGIYIGNNKFIHASSFKHYVTINKLQGYYLSHFIAARRVLKRSF